MVIDALIGGGGWIGWLMGWRWVSVWLMGSWADCTTDDKVKNIYRVHVTTLQQRRSSA